MLFVVYYTLFCVKNDHSLRKSLVCFSNIFHAVFDHRIFFFLNTQVQLHDCKIIAIIVTETSFDREIMDV